MLIYEAYNSHLVNQCLLCHCYATLQYYIDVACCYRWSSIVCLSVCLSVGQSVTVLSLAKVAEPMSFGLWTWVGPRNHILDGGAHWHHLANTIEPSMHGNDAALCQITLTTCYYRCCCSQLVNVRTVATATVIATGTFTV